MDCKRQGGISLISVLIVGALAAFVLIIGFRTVPAVNEFMAVQRIFAENLPVLYFVAPRMYYAHSIRLRGVVPSVLRPPVLWNADSLSVAPID